MSDAAKDLCPMCGGCGTHTIQPPNGKYYIRIRAVLSEEDEEYLEPEFSYEECDKKVNRLAAQGYELHSFAEDSDGTTWIMRWPYRWRSVL